MQITTTGRHHHAPTRDADNTKCLRRGRARGPHTWLEERETVPPPRKHWRFWTKLNVHLTAGATPLVSIDHKERKSYVCMRESFELLCLVTESWEGPERPLAGNWINELWWNGAPLRSKKEPLTRGQLGGISGAPHRATEASHKGSLYMTFPKKQNCSDGEQTSGCQGLWARGGRDRQAVPEGASG